MANLIIFNKIYCLRPHYGKQGSLIFLKDKIYFVIVSGINFIASSAILDLFKHSKIKKELTNQDEEKIEKFILDKEYLEIPKSSLEVFMPKNWFSVLKLNLQGKKYSFNVGSERARLPELQQFLTSNGYKVIPK